MSRWWHSPSYLMGWALALAGAHDVCGCVPGRHVNNPFPRDYGSYAITRVFAVTFPAGYQEHMTSNVVRTANLLLIP